MRFIRAALVALAASMTSVKANALRQHYQRSLIDTCANVNADVKVLGLVVGHLNLCICISAIPQLLSTNLVLKAAVALVGNSAVTALVTGLINAAPDHATCNYPDHAVPVCSASNPCGFSCSDGFTPYPASYPTQCVCNAPYTVCNGKCGNFPSCGSQYPKRDAAWRDATCPHGWSACGVWGGSRLDYECVDTRKDLWSCGGCSIPLLSEDPVGIDCTAIPGVHDVSCRTGRCVVERCKDGLSATADGMACVPATRMSHPGMSPAGSPPFMYNPYAPRGAEAEA